MYSVIVLLLATSLHQLIHQQLGSVSNLHARHNQGAHKATGSSDGSSMGVELLTARHVTKRLQQGYSTIDKEEFNKQQNGKDAIGFICPKGGNNTPR